MQTMPHDESQCNDRLSKSFNWRDHLKVHPAADLFPLLEPDELQALADDIKKNGLLTPIVLWREYWDDDTPVVLTDGRNRLDALASLGWLSLNPVRERGRGERVERYKRYVSNNPPFEISDECALNPFGLLRDPTGFEISNDDPYALALSLNVHRRHLNAEQKRELIAKILKAKPEASDRQIASQVKADHKTVGVVRSELEGRGEIPHVETRTDSKGRQQPAKKKSALVDGDADSSAQARKDHYAAAEDDGSLEEKIFSGATVTQTDVKEWRKRERERRKEALPEGEDDERVTLGDYFELHKRARKLEDRNNELSAALNAKEAQAARNWPADMTPRQLKQRDKCLKQIAAWQRQLEQLHGEVTGTPSWRVEVSTKDGKQLGTGARFGTRGEAEFYNTHFATSQLEGDYAAGDVIPCKDDKPNVEIEGDRILFDHGGCVLLDWRPIAETAE